jgi:hypothetical protein
MRLVEALVRDFQDDRIVGRNRNRIAQGIEHLLIRQIHIRKQRVLWPLTLAVFHWLGALTRKDHRIAASAHTRTTIISAAGRSSGKCIRFVISYARFRTNFKKQ